MDTYSVRVSGVSLTEWALLLNFASSHWACISSPSLPKDCCCCSILISCSPAAASVLSLCFLSLCLPFLSTSFAPYVLAAAKWSLSGYIQWRSLLGVLCWVALPAAGKRALCCLGSSDLIPSLTAGATPPELWLMLPNLCLHTDNDGRFLPRKLYIVELTSL